MTLALSLIAIFLTCHYFQVNDLTRCSQFVKLLSTALRGTLGGLGGGLRAGFNHSVSWLLFEFYSSR